MAVKVAMSRGIKIAGEPEPLDSAPVRVSVERHAGWGGGWVARIEARDPSQPGGFRRSFLKPYERALSRSGNGVVRFEITEPGVYEAEYIYRSFRAARAFIAVRADGSVRLLADYEKGEGRTRAADRAIDEALAEYLLDRAVENGEIATVSASDLAALQE